MLPVVWKKEFLTPNGTSAGVVEIREGLEPVDEVNQFCKRANRSTAANRTTNPVPVSECRSYLLGLACAPDAWTPDAEKANLARSDDYEAFVATPTRRVACTRDVAEVYRKEINVDGLRFVLVLHETEEGWPDVEPTDVIYRFAQMASALATIETTTR